MPAVGKIRGIMLTKNEADVVGACIEDALKWIDQIIVYDHTSTDGTWEIVQDWALKDNRVVPWKQHDQPFRDGLRGEVFNAFSNEAQDGDWWCCRLDSDEFYYDKPRPFLESISPWHWDVWGLHLSYYLTESDLEELNFSLPFHDLRPLIKHYKADSTERRFFRHRASLKWKPSEAYPQHVGVICPSRIRIRHYKYRNPTQIQARLNIRRVAAAHGFEGWPHAQQTDWREKIARDGTLLTDDGSGLLHEPDKNWYLYFESPFARVVKYAMHGLRIWS